MPDLDHRHVQPPYLRLTERRTGPNGDVAAMWHLRVAQPNVAQLPAAVAHSVEHFLFELLSRTETIVSVGVMGCRTGFYITAIGVEDYETMADLVAGILTDVAAADAVPHADHVHCGAAENHTLVGAKRVAAWLLNNRDQWADAGPNAQEV
jgi:S-ribosylhomocysteine lyase